MGSVLNCLCATEELLHKRYNRNIIVTLLLTVRRTLRAAIDDRAFPVAAAQLWNQRIYKLLKLFCLEQPACTARDFIVVRATLRRLAYLFADGSSFIHFYMYTVSSSKSCSLQRKMLR